MNVSVEKALGFYWDIENCHVPRGKSAFDVVQKLRSMFGSLGSEVGFICVCDVSKESSRIITELSLAQVDIIHVCSQRKNAVDDKLKSLLRRYGATYRPPGTVVLISSDVDFAAELNDLKNRLGFVTILLHNDHVSPRLLAYTTLHCSWSSLFNMNKMNETNTNVLFESKNLKRHHKYDKYQRYHTDASASELDGKVVALYFSARWCAPCRAFTPLLKEFYNEAGTDLEIVFVSFDRSAEDLAKYLDEAHGDWLFIPFGDNSTKELSEKFGVNSIPQLIVVKADGSVINKNARNDVQSKAKSPATLVAEWKQQF